MQFITPRAFITRTNTREISIYICTFFLSTFSPSRLAAVCQRVPRSLVAAWPTNCVSVGFCLANCNAWHQRQHQHQLNPMPRSSTTCHNRGVICLSTRCIIIIIIANALGDCRVADCQVLAGSVIFYSRQVPSAHELGCRSRIWSSTWPGSYLNFDSGPGLTADF